MENTKLKKAIIMENQRKLTEEEKKKAYEMLKGWCDSRKEELKKNAQWNKNNWFDPIIGWTKK